MTTDSFYHQVKQQWWESKASANSLRLGLELSAACPCPGFVAPGGLLHPVVCSLGIPVAFVDLQGELLCPQGTCRGREIGRAHV